MDNIDLENQLARQWGPHPQRVWISIAMWNSTSFASADAGAACREGGEEVKNAAMGRCCTWVSCSQCFMTTPWVGLQWCWMSLTSDPQAQVLLCSFLCCLFGWAHCSNIYDGKPVEKCALDKRKLMSLCLADFDVHGSHSPWLPFLCILTGLHRCLVTPSPSLQPALQAEARERFLIPGEPGYFRSHSKDLG